VMGNFDSVLETLSKALTGTCEEVDPATLPDLIVIHRDDAAKLAEVEIASGAWLTSDAARASSLRSANRLRLCGWRLRRSIADDGT
jgi:hypothetical protein